MLNTIALRCGLDVVAAIEQVSELARLRNRNHRSLLQNEDFRSKSRHAKNFTAGI